MRVSLDSCSKSANLVLALGVHGWFVSAHFQKGKAKHIFLSRSLWPIGALREALNRGLNMWFYEYLYLFTLYFALGQETVVRDKIAALP